LARGAYKSNLRPWLPEQGVDAYKEVENHENKEDKL
jgi:hypothetical protein